MEKIKVKGKLYDIRSIQTIEQHVLQIIFACTPPTKWNGDIVLYTAGDIECAVLTGWNTVYRDEGQTVYLSACTRHRIRIPVARSFHRNRMFRLWKSCRQRKNERSVRHVRPLSIPESMSSCRTGPQSILH